MRCLALLIILFLPLCAFSARASADAPTPATSCLFQYDAQRAPQIRISVLIDGKGPFTVALDSGATESVVTSSVAGTAGITPTGTANVTGVGTSSQSETGTIDNLAINTVVMREQPCLITDTAHIPHGCDGVLGGSIFEYYVLQLDFKSKVMTLYPNGSFAPAPGDFIVPVKLANEVPICTGTIGDLPVRLAIDTGFNGWLALFPSFVAANQLTKKYPLVGGASESTAGGGSTDGLYLVDHINLDLGSQLLEIHHVYTLLRTDTTEPSNPAFDGQIGLYLLAHWTVTFDYAHSRVILRG